MPLVHLDCPSCGGTLSLAEGERIVACRYCGGPSLVLVPDAVPRHVVQAALDEAAAVRAAKAGLERPGVPSAVRQGRFEAVGLSYVPFYEATAVRLGTIFVRDRVKPPAPLTDGDESPGESV